MEKRVEKKGYISVEEFAIRCNLKKNTIINNIEKIYGTIKIGNNYLISDTARYPFNVRNNFLKTRMDKIYVLLRATSEEKYIDEVMLKTSKNSFKLIIDELCEKNLLRNNNNADLNGANAYNTTIEGKMFLHNKKSKVIQSIMETLGSFTGKVLRECLE